MARVKMSNKKRIIQAFIIIMALIFVLALRTAWIQVVKADEYSEKATNQQMSDIPIEAKRGSIYDANGQELAASATCYAVWVRPSQIEKNYSAQKVDELSKKLAVILNKKSSTVKKDLTSKQTLVKIAKYLDKTTCDKVRALKISGLEIAENTKRYYPLGTSAAQLLGSVNDDNEGRTGIESQFDGYLSGVAGRWIKETDINGDTLSYGSQKYYQAKDGYNVQLTVDEVLQHYAEKAIAAGMTKTRAKRIMCLVMNPKTGDILAMATNPAFDPNDATEPTTAASRKYFSSLSVKKQGQYLSEMWKNPLVSDLYEPGSTFKLVTTSAALEEGVTTPTTHYYDTGSIRVDGTTLHCWNLAGHGAETLVQAVGNSCNPVQVRLALKMGKQKYYNYLEMFGITDITHVDLPAETSAIIKDESSLTNVDLATMAFGQGIAVTPIQLLTAVCSIGNDGVIMKPRIVEKLTDSSGKTVKEYKTQKVRKVISSKTASEMKDIMEYVVSKGGGGNAKITGYRIGGKTGTANKVANGKYTDSTWSSFVGMAPMEDPQLAILVIVDSPKGVQYGSATAAPIARSFLKNALTYLEIAPKYTEAEKKAMGSGTVYVPDLKGKSYSDAIGILGSSGLKYKVSPAVSGNKDFTIVDQYPKAGKKAEKGDTIYLYRK
jgi:stage V sporulation protein D (sporulation-specific penicillin-binding protein)